MSKTVTSARAIRVGRYAIGLRHSARGRWTTTLTEDSGTGQASARVSGPFRIGRRSGAATNADLLGAMRCLLPMSDAEMAAWEAKWAKTQTDERRM